MTFIASIVAKEGVALIADSLVTSKIPSIDMEEFSELIRKKGAGSSESSISFTQEELKSLLKMRTSHTKDFERKLFMFDKYSSILTAGRAEINGKRISELIDMARAEILGVTDSDGETSIEKGDEFAEEIRVFFRDQAVDELTKINRSITATSFIFTVFDKTTCIVNNYRINLNGSDRSNLTEPDLLCTINKDPFAVVCDGQNSLIERILFGDIHHADKWVNIIKDILIDIAVRFSIDDSLIEKYIQDELNEHILISKFDLLDGFKLNQLASLSLQQAVDLAWLLMKLEMDFQKYTENIPSVGGVIKLAIIDKEGFRFIQGDSIVNPIY